MILEFPDDYPVNDLFNLEAMRSHGLVARHVAPGHVRYQYARVNPQNVRLLSSRNPNLPEMPTRSEAPEYLDLPAFLRESSPGPDDAA